MSWTHSIIVSAGPERRHKDRRQRQIYFADWLIETGRPWYQPDLDAYRDHLSDERNLTPKSIASHISTIRTTFRELLERRDIHELIAQSLPDTADDPEEAIATALDTMSHATSRQAGAIEVDRDSQHEYLTSTQIEALFDKPNLTTAIGRRDIIIMGLILCCGLKDDEVGRLQESDIYVYDLDRRPAIHVSSSTHSRERIAPIYDDLLFEEPWLLAALQKMAHWSDLKDGYLFPGYRRDGETQTDSPIGPRSVQYMFNGYELRDQKGKPVQVTTLKLRRTYARRLYQLGIGIQKIRQNLGHKQLATTKDYVGPPVTTHEEADLRPYRATRMVERFVPTDMDWLDALFEDLLK